MTKAVAFEPLLERWGEYRLADGIRLRGRIHLTHVETPVAKDAGYHLRLNTLVETQAPADLKGLPTSNVGDLASRPVIRKHVSWQTIVEPISVYLLEDGALLRCTYRPKMIRQTDAFNQHGEPIVLVDGEQEILSDPSFDAVRRQHAQRAAKAARAKKKGPKKP